MMLISSSSSVAGASEVVQVNDLTAFRYERYYSGVVAVTNTASAQYIQDYDGSDWVTREIRRFIYDGWNLVGETRSTATGVSTNWYVWGLDMSGSIQGAGGVGGLLFANFWGNSRNYFGYDGNGNVSDLVAAGDGSLRAHYEYDPFGNTVFEEGIYTTVNPFRFSTKYWDTDTKLAYYGFRYYSPGMGRWVSKDPVSDFAQRPYLPLKQTEVLRFTLAIDLDEEKREVRKKDYQRFSSFLEEQNLCLAMGNDPISQIDLLGLECGVMVNRTKVIGVSSYIRFNAGHEWLVYPGGSMGFWPNRNWSLIRPDPAANKAGIPICWQWETEKLKSGKLKWGSAADTKCECATCDQITDCLKNVPNPGWRRWDFINNCRRFTGWAIGGCCLKKGKGTKLSCP